MDKKMQNLTEFIGHLRRYKKVDIVNIGSRILWDIFRNEGRYPIDISQVTNGYAPKLIMLALATMNNYKDKKTNFVEFFNLCHDLLSIKDCLNDEKLKDDECNQTLLKLKTKKIPNKYLKIEFIKKTYPTLYLARQSRIQHETYLVGMNELYITYDILMRLDVCTNGLLNNFFQNEFLTTPLHFMRALFGLFALGNENDGIIFFQELSCNESVEKNLDINIDLLESAAVKIACKESELRANWYNKGVLSVPAPYQKYYPTPLYKSPIVLMDLSKKIHYLIPSPGLFVRGTRDAIFSRVRKHKALSDSVGKII